MRDYVLLYINGRRHEVRRIATAPHAGGGPVGSLFQPLSTFLREHLRLTGTKVVCAEGDCGSCTVLLGTPEIGKGGGRGGMRYRTVCSCIQYLAQLDCTHIITVEGLRYDGKLNPLQESMVRNQGAQCGYCTPGFVVAMCALRDEKPDATESETRRSLVGNLCRCTGYEPILRACGDVHATELRPIAALYDTAAIAAELAAQEREPVEIADDGGAFCKPVTLAQATAFRAAHPDCLILSGGTDLGVQVNKGMRELRTVLSTRSLKELNTIGVQNNTLIAGGGVSIAELERVALEVLPEYGRMLAWFGSPPIKNAGTLGGNIANGSPIADSLPALYVLEAEIELAGANGESRRVPMNTFFTGYKKNVMAAGEMIARVHIPLPARGETFKVYKISKRKDLDISTFTAAFWLRCAGKQIEDIRIAYGGVGPNIIRLSKTEAYLRGQAMTEAAFAAAGVVAREEIAPISDVRGSAEFRLLLGENILQKFFAEVSAPTPHTTGYSATHANGNGSVRGNGRETHDV